MSRQTLSLDGPGWSVREALGETWRWYAAAPLPEADPGAGPDTDTDPGAGPDADRDADPDRDGAPDAVRDADAAAAPARNAAAPARNNAATAADAAVSAPGWIPAQVPGSVVTDLHRAGEIPDPRHARQSRAAEWTADRSWVYRRPVDVPTTRAGDRVVLELDGVDPGGEVLWDGVAVGRVSGLYHPGRVDLTAVATPGRHRLAVVVEPVPESEPQVGRTERVRRHAPRLNLGWDFCPRFPHQGLWRSVRLVVAATHVRDVQARTDTDPDLRLGRVHLSAVVEPGPDGADVEAVLLDDDAPIARARCTVEPPERGGPGDGAGPRPATARRVTLHVPVESPRLWWPNRHGDPHLHRLDLRVDGDPVWSAPVGFRHVRLVPNPGGPPSARPYTAVVNGVTVPLVGWNWVPVDAQHGAATPDRVHHLVDLAARSGARLLRVWGGGLVETETFYRACDRAGLLVWQELSQSSSGMSSAPASDAAFVEHLRDEARTVVPPRTHHPALLMWGGGNELDDGGVPLDEDRSPALAALRDEIARLDPGRHWVPTSPSGPAFHHRLDVIAAAPDDQHDVHGPWEHQGPTAHHTLYDAGTSLAHTEFGVEGMTTRRSLDALVPADRQWPPDRGNPVYRHLGEWWDNAEQVQAWFGGRLTDLATMRRASQLLQATGLAYAVEADRRRAPRCSMVLPWQLGESYPNAWCTSVLDFRGDAKPAFHAVTRAFADRRVTARVPTSVWAGRPAATLEAWVWATDAVPGGSRVTAVLRTADGTPLGTADAVLADPVRHPVRAVDLRVPLDGVPGDAALVWELTWVDAWGAPLDREVVLASTGADLSPLLDLAPARVDVRARTAPDGDWLVDVVHRSGPIVVGLGLDDARPDGAPGWAVVDGDPRPLLPGGRSRFRVHWRGAPGPRSVRVESWNTEPVEVDEGTLDAGTVPSGTAPSGTVPSGTAPSG